VMSAEPTECDTAALSGAGTLSAEPSWRYGDCGHEVVSQEWEHSGMTLPVIPPGLGDPGEGCER
jgi:hypothetical protein